jgi:hypothetical protein
MDFRRACKSALADSFTLHYRALCELSRGLSKPSRDLPALKRVAIGLSITALTLIGYFSLRVGGSSAGWRS